MNLIFNTLLCFLFVIPVQASMTEQIEQKILNQSAKEQYVVHRTNLEHFVQIYAVYVRENTRKEFNSNYSKNLFLNATFELHRMVQILKHAQLPDDQLTQVVNQLVVETATKMNISESTVDDMLTKSLFEELYDKLEKHLAESNYFLRNLKRTTQGINRKGSLAQRIIYTEEKVNAILIATLMIGLGFNIVGLQDISLPIQLTSMSLIALSKLSHYVSAMVIPEHVSDIKQMSKLQKAMLEKILGIQGSADCENLLL